MSVEDEAKRNFKLNKSLPEKYQISVLKYFWQASPLSSNKKDNIPKFLKQIKLLSDFSDNELRTLSSFFHIRSYSSDEVIFEQNDSGFGFYIIFTGHVEVMARKNIELDDSDDSELDELVNIATLERNDYFGELALLQEDSIRSATAVSREHTILLGLFKPDMDELLEYHPHLAAKFLKSISMILANRLSVATFEIKSLKYKLSLTDKNVVDKKL